MGFVGSPLATSVSVRDIPFGLTGQRITGLVVLLLYLRISKVYEKTWDGWSRFALVEG